MQWYSVTIAVIASLRGSSSAAIADTNYLPCLPRLLELLSRLLILSRLLKLQQACLQLCTFLNDRVNFDEIAGSSATFLDAAS